MEDKKKMKEMKRQEKRIQKENKRKEKEEMKKAKPKLTAEQRTRRLAGSIVASILLLAMVVPSVIGIIEAFR